MKIALTHEDADIDALASLLAVNLLDREVLPVLPNKINPNGCSFLEIYGADLPFVEMKNLPAERVEKLTLVATHDLPEVNGRILDCPVVCIDHKIVQSGKKTDWTYWVEPVGATVTILVEHIQKQELTISPVWAALFLAGIYEETGSFMSPDLSPRDLQAAAFLLSSGANLGLVQQMLFQPLSSEQQKFYAELVKTVETHQVSSENIFIACGDLDQATEKDFSSIVQKLGQRYQPGALFLLVKTGDGVLLIGRSSSDQVDVSSVARIFGGSGFRDSATLKIPGMSIDQVRTLLIDTLRRVVLSAVSVNQLMSLGLQTVPPGLLAFDAVELINRYGFEGFPVVQNNRVLGLLTRRAVDRAISHKLNLPASSLMMPGNYVVFPTDSVNKVSQLMMDTGWGQIPVADPQTGKLIGIVTRTDLIRSIEANSQPQKYKRNLAFLLETLIPKNRLALIKMAASQASEMRFPVYIVGGFVRDLILKTPSLDFDIVVEGEAIDLGRSLQKRIGGKLTTHARFGTAKWFLPADLAFVDGEFVHPSSSQLSSQADESKFPDFLDLVTARTEFYTEPSALPTVEGASIKLDIHRRDFTINTLALRLDGDHYGDLLDYWGGYSDLENGVVRVLHSLSFIDDPTRIMRAVRFEQRLGFNIETKTIHLIQSALELIKKLTGDRIHHEFEHCLQEANSARMFARLSELGVLAAIHPDLTWDAQMSNLVTVIPIDAPSHLMNIAVQDISNEPWPKFRNILIFGVWFSKLSSESLTTVTDRIHHPKSETEHIQQAQVILCRLPGLSDAAPSVIVQQLEVFSNMAVMIALTGSDNPKGKEILAAYLTHYRKVQSHFHGSDLIAAGIKPGPVFKQILGSLRMGLLDGTIHTIEEERVLLARLISEVKKSVNYE